MENQFQSLSALLVEYKYIVAPFGFVDKPTEIIKCSLSEHVGDS